MRIGELAIATGASVRSLRHYEANGLLIAERRGNGYREFSSEAVETVARIRALLAAGLPIVTIRKVLPCVQDAELEVSSCASLIAVLGCELEKLDVRAAQLERSRAAINRMLT